MANKMKKCPVCKIELTLLGLRYKKKFNQYLCTKCNLVYLETKIGLVNKLIIESVKYVMEHKKFMNLLNRLGEFGGINK